jgi:hypothetical protein
MRWAGHGKVRAVLKISVGEMCPVSTTNKYMKHETQCLKNTCHLK